jgi:hypothetical protein
MDAAVAAVLAAADPARPSMVNLCGVPGGFTMRAAQQYAAHHRAISVDAYTAYQYGVADGPAYVGLTVDRVRAAAGVERPVLAVLAAGRLDEETICEQLNRSQSAGYAGLGGHCRSDILAAFPLRIARGGWGSAGLRDSRGSTWWILDSGSPHLSLVLICSPCGPPSGRTDSLGRRRSGPRRTLPWCTARPDEGRAVTPPRPARFYIDRKSLWMTAPRTQQT